jgi:hypothetical protein
MAVLPQLTPLDIFNGQITNTTLVRNIQGRPLIVNYTLGELQSHNLGDDEIKLRLCNEIAAELYKQKMIEFTKEPRHETGDIHYRARIFAVPNSDVQFLRVQEIIK